VGGEHRDRVPLDTETKVERLGWVVVGLGEGAGAGVEGGWFGSGGIAEPLQWFGASEQKESGQEGDAGNQENAEAPVRTAPGLEAGPKEEAHQKNGESAARAVGCQAGDDGKNAEEGRNGGNEFFPADIGVNGAGEEDSTHGQPSGHMVGVGKDPVDFGDREREGPATNLKDEHQDARGGHKPSVGAKKEIPLLIANGLCAEPKQPTPAGKEEKKGFQ